MADGTTFSPNEFKPGTFEEHMNQQEMAEEQKTAMVRTEVLGIIAKTLDGMVDRQYRNGRDYLKNLEPYGKEKFATLLNEWVNGVKRMTTGKSETEVRQFVEQCKLDIVDDTTELKQHVSNRKYTPTITTGINLGNLS